MFKTTHRKTLVSLEKCFIGVAPTAGLIHSPKQSSTATAAVKVTEPVPEMFTRPFCAALRLFQDNVLCLNGTLGAESLMLLLTTIPCGRETSLAAE